MSGELFRIELRAADPARNRWRFYRVTAEQDLLGDWVVRLNYGRIGARGQFRTYLVADAAGASRRVRASLKRRQSAPKRIGITYTVRETCDPLNWLDGHFVTK